MVRNLANLDFFLDDESYFSKSNKKNSGNSGFYASDVSSTPNDVKYKPKQKFEEHILVYVVISFRGISKPYIVPSGLAIIQEVYTNQFLRKYLISHIKRYYSENEYVFWPDLASAHYLHKAIAHLESKR